MAQTDIPLRPEAGEFVTAADAATTPAGTTTSLACYVQKGTDVKWQWGLNNDNSWYVLNGYWITTPYTGLTKFVTTTDQSQLVAAANKAIEHYGLAGYTVLAICAADKSAGYSYPIIAGDTELYPKY